MEENKYAYLMGKYPEGAELSGKIIDIQPFGYIIEISDEQGLEIAGKHLLPLAFAHKGQYYYDMKVEDVVKGIVCGYRNWLVYITDVKRVE